MADHDARERALDRAWDALVTGSVPSAADDPTGAETIRRFHAARDVPGPDPAFLARLEEELMPVATATVPLLGARARTVGPNGDVPPAPPRDGSPLPVFPARRRLAVAQVLLAASLLLLLGLGARARWRDEPEHAAGIPAPDAAATSSLGTAEQSLFTFVFALEELPRSEAITGVLIHFSIPPGTRSTWTPLCCRGPHAEMVVSGSYTVRVEAPIRVVRADGALEEIPAGVEVVLGPGDGLVSRTDVVFEAANDGAEPVELLSWAVMDDPDGNNVSPTLPGWAAHDYDGVFNLKPADGLAVLRLRRMELAPGASLPTTPGAVEMAIRFDPTLVPAFGAAGAPARNTGSEPLTIYLATLEPARPNGPDVG